MMTSEEHDAKFLADEKAKWTEELMVAQEKFIIDNEVSPNDCFICGGIVWLKAPQNKQEVWYCQSCQVNNRGIHLKWMNDHYWSWFQEWLGIK